MGSCQRIGSLRPKLSLELLNLKKRVQFNILRGESNLETKDGSDLQS